MPDQRAIPTPLALRPVSYFFWRPASFILRLHPMNKLYAYEGATRLPASLGAHGLLVATKGLDGTIILPIVRPGNRLPLELKPSFVRILCLETLYFLQVTRESVHMAAHLATPRKLEAAMDTANSLSSLSSSTTPLSAKSSSASRSTSVVVSKFLESVSPISRLAGGRRGRKSLSGLFSGGFEFRYEALSESTVGRLVLRVV